jgi:hypothetical protein
MTIAATVKEFFKKVFEDFQKPREEGFYVGLYEFSNLILDVCLKDGERKVSILGVDKSQGIAIDISLQMFLSEERPVRKLPYGNTVYVPTDLFGQPVAVDHPDFFRWSFIINF